MLKFFCVPIAILLGLLVPLHNADAEELSAIRLQSEIKKYGPRHVVQKLTATSWAPFDRVCRMVETGNRKWLKVAKLLKPGTDAGSAESLDFAVARALPKVPADVLSMVQGEEHNVTGGFGLADVCTVPFLEEEQQVVDRYLASAELALEKMKKDNRHRKLETLRRKCLERIRSYMEK